MRTPDDGALTPDEIDALAVRARGGEHEALEELLAVVRPRVLGACRGVLPYSDDAEDACQEALLNVATRIRSWHGRGRFTTWLYQVSVNASRSTYRRLRNQAVAMDVAPLERPDPRTTSVNAGTRLDLLDAVDALSQKHPQYVEPLLLRDVQGLPYAEIARLLDVPVGTVKAQVHHGRGLVRPLLRAQA